MGLPVRRCSSISPRATMLVAKSNTYGLPAGRGQANAMGFVPNTGRVPPAGATQLWLGVMAMPARPCSAMASTSGHNAEKWKQLLMARTATPLRFAFSARCGSPSWNASNE
ncbi:hypothetical protein D3C87_1843360 [compost metagenome]